MKEKVVFFNYFHNGDIHLSRNFVKYLGDIFTLEGFDCYYFHKNDSELLKDIDVKHILKCSLPSEKILSKKINDTIYLSTWYGADSFKFINKFGITFNCLYHIIENHIQTYLPNHLEKYLIVDKKEFFPEIDYTYFDTCSVNRWILKDNRKKVLISNGKVLSGQFENINFDLIIDKLSKQFPEILFIPTNKTNVMNDNVLMSSDIIGKINNDLNENSYLSTFCDVIVGCLSGTYSFSIIKHNMFDRNCTFIGFSNLGVNGAGALWYDEKDFSLDYSAKIIGNSTHNVDVMFDIISQEIRRIKDV